MPQSFELPCRVRFTTRRGSIALRILADEVRILAPRGTRKATIEGVLQQRRPWIESSIARLREQQRQQPDPSSRFANGAILKLDDRPLTLTLHPSSVEGCEIDGDRLRLSLSNDSPERRLTLISQWYQQQAEQRWPALLDAWSERTGLTPTGLKIRPYKSRWGACTAAGLVSLNTQLMQAPVAVQEYVIVHELCHLRHLNHSPAYWALVQQWCPDYARRRRWLRQQGNLLQLG
nr:SprT family zinc-dependent metalloprotease [Motiliproteus sediminis]